MEPFAGSAALTLAAQHKDRWLIAIMTEVTCSLFVESRSTTTQQRRPTCHFRPSFAFPKLRVATVESTTFRGRSNRLLRNEAPD